MIGSFLGLETSEVGSTETVTPVTNKVSVEETQVENVESIISVESEL